MKVAITTDTHYGYDHNTHKIHVKFLNKLRKACEDNDVKALIHCGDWIACDQHQLPRTWKMFREAMGNLPIIGVKGNHDRWDHSYWGVPARKRRWAKHPAGMSFVSMEEQHQEWADEYNIHLLQDNPYRYDDRGEEDTSIIGYNGWYRDALPQTNDLGRMFKAVESCPAGAYLQNQAHKNLQKCLDEVSYLECENPKLKIANNNNNFFI